MNCTLIHFSSQSIYKNVHTQITCINKQVVKQHTLKYVHWRRLSVVSTTCAHTHTHTHNPNFIISEITKLSLFSNFMKDKKHYHICQLFYFTQHFGTSGSISITTRCPSKSIIPKPNVGTNKIKCLINQEPGYVLCTSIKHACHHIVLILHTSLLMQTNMCQLTGNTIELCFQELQV